MENLRSDIQDLTERIKKFRDARDWKQFHTSKDLALSLVMEATEVMEHVQWKNGEELDTYLNEHKADVGDELADTLYYLLLLADKLDIDLYTAALFKLEKTKLKYPINKSKGNHTKYTNLQ